MFLFRRGPSIFLAVAYVLVVAMTTAQECDLPRHEPFVSIPGDVTLVGLYDVYGGPRCTEPRSGGVQRLTAGAWAVTRLNNLSYTYPLKLGFKAYDTCTNARSAFKRVIQSLVDGSYLQDTNCQKGSPIIGFIGPSSATIASPVSAFVKLFNFTHLPLHLDFLDNEIKVSIAVLLQLNWRQVALLSSSYIVSEKFHQASSLANICVSVSEELFSDRLLPQQCQYLYEEIRQSGTRVVVVLGYDFEVVKTLQYAEKCNSTNLYWLTVGLNDADAISDFQMKIISVTTSEQRFPDLEDRVYLEIDGNTSDEWSSHENNSGLHNCFSTGFLAQIRTDAPVASMKH
ncbi:metabotropic glutamate receptor 4-like [Tachypleus tridentatus]|uniref:metabotropic glutamate receptor 4-like n=1 Tax=Tachypleus tridentatus TaxID=6853 RepID=UPI003FD35012